MLRKCLDCGIEAYNYEELSLFAQDKTMKHGYKNLCKGCHYQRNKKLDGSKPENARNRAYKSNYGITLDDYNIMFDKQKGKCKICGVQPNKHLLVDHCHTSKEVRGLLCHNCNTLLGHAKDNIVILSNAIRYLASKRDGTI